MRASISKMLIPLVALCAMLAGSQAQAQDRPSNVYHNTVSVRYMIRDVAKESKAFRHRFEQRYDDMFQSNWRRSDDSRHVIQEMDKAWKSSPGERRPARSRDIFETMLRG